MFSVNYRLAPEAEFPAAVQDVASAAHWVRTHTRDYGVDARRVALVGIGEGGYLAALSAVGGAHASAVVSLAGWSDLRNQRLPEGLRAFLGVASIESASPAMHISGKEPPFLLVHGDADEVTPLEQSVHFQAALQAAGVPCRLLIVEGGRHDTATWTGRPWEREMVGWLKRALSRK
ncbi:MAG: alpha/beta hydrolase [Bryobacterales bacterium]|nr:alpha/beta hydrolase [Bryobacterales bacterium]